MSEIKKLYEKLELYAQNDFNSGEYCEEFLDTAHDITLKKDPTSIPILLKYFNEDTDYDWIFECLMGYMENYDNEFYVEKIIESSDFLNKNDPVSVECFFYVMLNTPECLRFLKEMLKSQKALNDVTPILERIMNDSKEHEGICRELLNSKTAS